MEGGRKERWRRKREREKDEGGEEKRERETKRVKCHYFVEYT